MSALVTACTARPRHDSHSARAGSGSSPRGCARKGHGHVSTSSLPKSRPRRKASRLEAYAPERRLPVGSEDDTAEEQVDDKPTGDDASSPEKKTTRKPTLCFVNGKSGGRRGEALMGLLAEQQNELNVVEIVDLNKEPPERALIRHVGATKPPVQILVCGGDGTVTWVLQAMEELGEDVPKPPIGILPLGTGNDLARVFGWGARYDDALLRRLASAFEAATPKALDRWDVTVTRNTPGEHGQGGDSVGDTGDTATRASRITLHNYLGIGVDAKAALAFHDARDAHPGLFFSPLTNKALYGLFGAIDAVTHSCRGLLAHHITLVADGVQIPLPKNAEGLILLNLNSYAGGARMWNSGPVGAHRRNWVSALLSGGFGDTMGMGDGDDDGDETVFGKSKRADGLIDVVAIYGAVHLGQLSLGTDRPVRLCQARSVSISVTKSFPIQVDGQPWFETAGNGVGVSSSTGEVTTRITVTRKDTVNVLAVDPVANLGSGRGYFGPDDEFDFDLSTVSFFGWETWEDLAYYEDLDQSKSAAMLD